MAMEAAETLAGGPWSRQPTEQAAMEQENGSLPDLEKRLGDTK